MSAIRKNYHNRSKSILIPEKLSLLNNNQMKRIHEKKKISLENSGTSYETDRAKEQEHNVWTTVLERNTKVH